MDVAFFRPHSSVTCPSCGLVGLPTVLHISPPSNRGNNRTQATSFRLDMRWGLLYFQASL